MKIYIDGSQVNPDVVTFSELGFGMLGSGQVRVYEIQMTKQEFVHTFNSTYDDAITELKADDAITGRFDPPYAGATDYPSLQHFVQVNGAAFEAFVYAYLKFDIFAQYFSSSDDQSAKFALVTLDHVEMTDLSIVLKGRARELSLGTKPESG